MKRHYPQSTITAFSHFISVIEELAEVSPQGLLLFRGQDCDSPLIPRVGRINEVSDIRRFEKAIFSDFKKRAIPFLKNSSYDDWNLLAVAQHFGLPTRLLDWTENPLMALWFATKKDIRSTEKAVVWAFDPEEEDIVDENDKSPFSGQRTKVFSPNHISERIVAQSGWFTCHKLTSANKFIAFERNKHYQDCISKLTIPAQLFPEIRVKLNSMGINASTVYPDLEGVSAYLTWKHIKGERF